MIRSALILTMSFAVGFALCLVARAGLHHPYAAGPATAGAPLGMAPAEHEGAHDHGAGAPAPATAPPAQGAGAAGAAPAPPPAARAAAPGRFASSSPEVGLPRLGVATEVANSVCPVCGAEVDASLPTSIYHGRIIGFGCRPARCKERFDADPERFGPAALANRKAE
jgi:hypothetical protein